MTSIKEKSSAEYFEKHQNIKQKTGINYMKLLVVFLGKLG